VRATDRLRLEHFADGVERLVRRARSGLFLSVITALILVVVLAYATPPDATIFEIYIAAEGDDASPGEALPPTSVAPLRARNAGALLLGDCWSARVARTLMTVRGRAPPGKNATGRITIPAPPSVPVDLMCLPAVPADSVVALCYRATTSVQKRGRSPPGSRGAH
jgi:hypothetical protein